TKCPSALSIYMTASVAYDMFSPHTSLMTSGGGLAGSGTINPATINPGALNTGTLSPAGDLPLPVTSKHANSLFFSSVHTKPIECHTLNTKRDQTKPVAGIL